MRKIKIISLLLLSGSLLSFSAANSYAGFHLGLASAIKAKVQELKDKKMSKDEESNKASSWVKQLGTTNEDRAYGVTIDPAGNIYITGWTNGNLDGNANQGQEDIFLAKYSSDGVKLWVKQFGTSDKDWSTGIAIDITGNIYVTGWTYGSFDGNINQNIDIFLAKYDTNGASLWLKQFGTDSRDNSNGIAIDQSGNIYITGYTEGNLDGVTKQGAYNMFLTRYDSNGNRIWTELAGTGAGSGIAVDSSGYIYVTGWAQTIFDGGATQGINDVFLIKYDSNGVKLWTKMFGSSGQDLGYGVATDQSGNTYVTGWSNDQDWGIFLAKYDTNGVNTWVKKIGTSSWNGVNGVATDQSGNAYVTGYTEGAFAGYINQGNFDLFLIKFDTNGNNLWTKQIGTDGADDGYAVSTDISGNIFIAGVTEGDLEGNRGQGGGDALLIKSTP